MEYSTNIPVMTVKLRALQTHHQGVDNSSSGANRTFGVPKPPVILFSKLNKINLGYSNPENISVDYENK